MCFFKSLKSFFQILLLWSKKICWALESLKSLLFTGHVSANKAESLGVGFGQSSGFRDHVDAGPLQADLGTLQFPLRPLAAVSESICGVQPHAEGRCQLRWPGCQELRMARSTVEHGIVFRVCWTNCLSLCIFYLKLAPSDEQQNCLTPVVNTLASAR